MRWKNAYTGLDLSVFILNVCAARADNFPAKMMTASHFLFLAKHVRTLTFYTDCQCLELFSALILSDLNIK